MFRKMGPDEKRNLGALKRHGERAENNDRKAGRPVGSDKDARRIADKIEDRADKARQERR